MQTTQQRFSIGYFVATIIALLVLQAVLFAPHAETPCQALFLNVPSLAQREFSEETARRIDTEIEQLLARAHLRVQQTLGTRRATLEALAKRLIEKEVVDRAALPQLIADTESATQSGAERA